MRYERDLLKKLTSKLSCQFNLAVKLKPTEKVLNENKMRESDMKDLLQHRVISSC